MKAFHNMLKWTDTRKTIRKQSVFVKLESLTQTKPASISRLRGQTDKLP
jgi:hypothetical protein